MTHADEVFNSGSATKADAERFVQEVRRRIIAMSPEQVEEFTNSFDMQPEREAHLTSREDDGAMTGGNVWPESLPGFREAVLEY